MQDLVGRSEWVRPKPWKLDWELRKDGRVIATMSSPKMFGTAVSAIFEDQAYSLRKGGLRRPGATMRKLGDHEDLAVLTFDTIGKGIIVFPGPAMYSWEREEGDRWTLSQEDRGAIFVTVRDTKGKYSTGRVEVDIADPLLPPLLLLTWFMASTAEC